MCPGRRNSIPAHTSGTCAARMKTAPSFHFQRIRRSSLSVVFGPESQVDPDVGKLSKVRPIEQVDRGLVDAHEVLVEQRTEEPRTDVVHGHAAAKLVEGRHDNRFSRKLWIPLVLPKE